MRALILGAALIFLLAAAPAQAQESGRAGLVVVTGEGDPVTRCVDLNAESISGYDLLAASRLEINSELSAVGASICSLEGVGCSYPAETCFCQCQGSPCVYWSYWQQDDGGAWRYAATGALLERVRDGDVQGWVWGPGTVADAPEPPALTFDAICAPDAAKATAAVTTTVPVSATELVLAAPAQESSVRSVGLDLDLQTAAVVALVVLIPLGVLVLLRRRQGV